MSNRRTDMPKRSLRASFVAVLLRTYLALHLLLMRVLNRIRYRRPIPDDGADVLLTGTFYSDNWLLAHIRPIGMSEGCRKVTIVMTYDLKSFDNVEVITPPRWLRTIVGDVGARLIVFLLIAIRRRPHFVGGFHLLFNGLVASFVARLCGSRSIYFCVGGPVEVQDGGLLTENRIFEKIETPDKKIERRLFAAVDCLDQVITMGTTAKRFFEENGISAPIEVVSGGIVIPAEVPPPGDRLYDVAFIGRLAPIKRVDLFIRMVERIREVNPEVRAVIVGDGAERQALEALAAELELKPSLDFIGFQPSVAPSLLASKIFVLTSRSEGLSLALMEAMASGLVPVVSDVGDLGDIVVDGENGALVADQTPDGFAAAVLRFLEDESELHRASESARSAARDYSLQACSDLWRKILDADRRVT